MYRDLIGCEILIWALDIPTRNFHYLCRDRLYGFLGSVDFKYFL